MDKSKLALGKVNFILMAVGVVIILIGFVLMSGGNSNETTFDPSIFNAMRIKVAPVVSLIGFVSIIGAILYKGKDKKEDK